MGKYVVAALLAIAILLFASCSTDVIDIIETGQPDTSPLSPTPGENDSTPVPVETSKETDPPDETAVPTDGPGATDEPEVTEEPDERTPHENNPLLELARQGKVDGIEFGIGAKTKDIVDKWGRPDDSAYFLGGLYYSYDDKDIVFFTNEGSIGEDGNEIVNGDVVIIGITGKDRSAYNVRLGMTIIEIITVLGEPTYTDTPEDNIDSELFSGWTFIYDVGVYSVCFAADTKDSPVTSLYLWENN